MNPRAEVVELALFDPPRQNAAALGGSKEALLAGSRLNVVNVADFHAGGAARARFIDAVGSSLEEIGFFAVEGHDVTPELVARAYDCAKRFFALPEGDKARYFDAAIKGQRGFTPFGREHAKDSPAPDLKEFWQVGRPDVPDEHPVHRRYGPNRWPDDVVPGFGAAMTELYTRLDRLGGLLLEACAAYIDEPAHRFSEMAREGDTILRVIHYPPVPEGMEGSVRAAAHEDINLITLLCGATASGLELKERDGSWRAIESGGEQIVVDAGDMLQNVTNGLYRSTTHRVMNPPDSREERFSIPCFIHPRGEADLTPLSSCVARTGGEARYPSITAGAYLDERLREIGLG